MVKPVIAMPFSLVPAYIQCQGNSESCKPEVFYVTLESNICDYLSGILLVQIPCLPGYYR